MNRRRFTGLGLIVASVPFLGGWMWGKRGKPQTDAELKEIGYIVTIDPPDMALEGHATGLTDTGALIIRTGFDHVGQEMSFSAGTREVPFPRWVRVTYRGLFDPKDVEVRENRREEEKIFTEYHIEILNRIPEDVFEYVLAKQPPGIHRIIRLKFRLTDNGVLFGWDVQQTDLNREKDSRGHNIIKSPRYAMAGGDFLDERVGPLVKSKKSETIDMRKVVIQPQFDQVKGFSEGLAAVRLGDKWGYIDKTGKLVILPQFYLASEFSEGLAGVYYDKVGNRLIGGHIDKTGKIVTQGVGTERFSEGLAVASRDGKSGYIDKTGEFVIPPQFYDAKNFSEGLAAVSWDNGQKRGFIDKTGKVVIQPQPFFMSFFKEGLVRISRTRAVPMADGTYMFGYMDRTGKIVIPLQFHSASDFSEGLASVNHKDGRSGYIDKTGKMVIPLQYSSGSVFSEGLAFVTLGPGGKHAYIDKTGKIVFQFQVDLGSGSPNFSFSEGLARVRVRVQPRGKYPYKYAYIDKTGRMVIRPQFDDAGDFSEGLAPVRLNGKWGYISH